LQTELTEEKSQSLTHRSYRGEHNTFTSRKKKIVTLNVIKKFCMQARNILTNLRQSPARLITLHHVKSFILRVLRT